VNVEEAFRDKPRLLQETHNKGTDKAREWASRVDSDKKETMHDDAYEKQDDCSVGKHICT
jgi:hypothetical protein